MLFICIKITAKKTKTPETIAPQGISKKHTWATFFPPKFDLNDDPNMGRRTLSWRYSRVWVGNI